MTDLSALIDKLSPQARTALAQRLADAGAVPSGSGTDEPVALVGIGCRYPGGIASPADFWDLVTEGRDAIGPFPAERWGGRVNGLDPDDPFAGNPVRSGGFLDDADGFDASFFGISPSEAVGMDPQQRVLLEVAWEALEHAGVAPRGLAGSQTGVYIGIAAPDYIVERLHDPATRGDLHTITGAIHSTAVGRLSYLLDLRGPSVAVDTACSSSLVAIHLACQSLRTGDSDLALAGGVHVISSVLTSFGLRAAGLADEDSRCKTFDASASGIARAEGCGVVVLKRLSDARRDGDRVLAVIRGSAVNQDGRSTSLTAPSVAAQRDVLTDALRRAGIGADEVGLVEAHGTGTVLGDPIEVEAIASVYGRGDRGACALGAVKTNFGHTEEAAGVAGLIKAVLALRAGLIPPNLHFRTLNPDISLDGTRLVIPQRAMDWPTRGPQRHAAVSSFGMGGTNAHVIVSTPPGPTGATAAEPATAAPAADRPVRPGPYAVTVSAGSPAALRRTAERLADWAEGPGAQVPVTDVAHTLARRSHLEERLVAVVDGTGPARQELPERLRAHLTGETMPGLVTGGVHPAARRGTVWVFPGQGGQWQGMGRELLGREPAFAAAVEELDPLVAQECGYSVRDLIAEGADPDTDIARSHVMIFVTQVALARTWESYGLRPAAVIGHSMGEIAAAVVAGGLPLPDAVRVVARRARLLSEDPAARGAMALVELSAEEAGERLAAHPDVSIAVLSGPQATVVSGAEATVEALVAEWEAEGLLARRIKGVTVASHSPTMDALLPALREQLAGLDPRGGAAGRLRAAFYSTAAATPRTEPRFDTEYWAGNLRNPVRFADAVAAAVEDGYRLFVEVAPHPVSEPQIVATAAAAGTSDVVVVPSLRRSEPERLTLLTHLAALHCRGVEVDLPLPGAGTLAEVPTTAWEHRRYWLREGGTAAAGTAPADLHPLLGVHVRLPGTAEEHLWQAEIGTDTVPWLAEHRINEVPVLPGTAYCEMALAAACEVFAVPAERVALADIDYQALLPLARPATVTVTLRREGTDRATVEIVSAGDGPDGRTVHATARARLLDDAADQAGDTPARDLARLLADHPERRGGEELYQRIRASDQYHGPAFRGTAELRLAADRTGPEISVVSTLTRPEEATGHPRLRTHPALLDGWFHLVVAAVLDDPRTYLPVGLGALTVHQDPELARVGHATLRPAPDGGGLLADVDLLAEDGRPVIRASAVYLREMASGDLPTSTRGKLFDLTWEPVPLPTAAASEDPGRVLVVAAHGGADDAVRALAGRDRVTAAPGEVAALLAADPGIGDVVVAAGDPHQEAAESDDALSADARARVLAAIETAAAIAAAPAGPGGRRPRLWLVTRGARALTGQEVPRLAQTGLRGLARTLVLEHPDLRTTLVDLDPADDGWDALPAELAAGTEDEVAWRGGTRYVARLRRADDTPQAADTPVVRRGGGYIVTGGLTGVGLYTAGWLASSGAGCVVLNARSEPGPEALEAIDAMRAHGTEVRVVRGDIAETGTAERLVKEVADAGRALNGVIHSAVVLDDGVIANLDGERLDRVWRPKALGAWRLHQATVDSELDWWVSYSSIAALIGGAGQANYAAANAFVDGLAEWRAARGLPALSVNWGGWAEIGKARDLVLEAFPMMPPAEGMDALAELIRRRVSTAGAMRLNAEALARTMPETTRSSFFAPLVEGVLDGGATDGWAGPQALGGLPADRLRQAVATRLRGRIGQILGYRAEDLTAGRPLTRMGLDSLMAVKTKNAVLADFGVTLPVARLLQGTTLTELEDQIVAALGGEQRSQEPSQAVSRAQERARARRTSRSQARRNR